MDLTSSILDSSGVINGEEFTKVFFSGLLKGMSLLFDSPLKIFLWVIILGLIILSWKLNASIRRKRMKQMAKYQAQAMLEAEEELKQRNK